MSFPSSNMIMKLNGSRTNRYCRMTIRNISHNTYWCYPRNDWMKLVYHLNTLTRSVSVIFYIILATFEFWLKSKRKCGMGKILGTRAATHTLFLAHITCQRHLTRWTRRLQIFQPRALKRFDQNKPRLNFKDFEELEFVEVAMDLFGELFLLWCWRRSSSSIIFSRS